jgi:hypothetical protein
MTEAKYLGYAAELNRSDKWARERGIPSTRLRRDDGPQRAERNRRANWREVRRRRFARREILVGARNG